MLLLFFINKQLQIITEIYNSLQLSLIIGYYNSYYRFLVPHRVASELLQRTPKTYN